MTNSMTAMENALTALRAAAETLDLDEGDYTPEYYAGMYLLCRDAETITGVMRDKATELFADLVPDEELVPLGGGKTAQHRRSKVGARRPDNDAFRGALRRAVAHELPGIDPEIVQDVLDVVQDVISLNVSNGKSGGLKPLGIDKNEYYDEAGHWESRLVIS